MLGQTFLEGETVDENNGIKVVMVLSNTQAPLGGTQKQAVCLANELQWQGGDVSVSLVSKRPRLFKVMGEGFREGEPPEEVNGRAKIIRLPITNLQPAWSFLLSFFIWACINRKSFQIIHAHNAPLGVIASLVGWLMRKKVVIKIPGMKYVEYLNRGSLFYQLRRWILTKKGDRFVAVSTEMAQALRQIGIPPQQITMIPNGIKLMRANSVPNRTALKIDILGDAEVQVVLYVGRLIEEKGLDRLLEVWASIPLRQGAVLLIVGDGSLREDLEAMAAALQISSSVRFLGYHPDVSKFYAIADLFVLPSKTEGLSNSLLEAMAAAVPVVASNVGGNNDVIEDQQSGFLLDWDDTTACVRILSTLLSHPNLRRRMGNAASRRVRAFAIGEVADQYKQLYQAVLRK